MTSALKWGGHCTTSTALRQTVSCLHAKLFLWISVCSFLQSGLIKQMISARRGICGCPIPHCPWFQHGWNSAVSVPQIPSLLSTTLIKFCTGAPEGEWPAASLAEVENWVRFPAGAPAFVWRGATTRSLDATYNRRSRCSHSVWEFKSPPLRSTQTLSTEISTG